MNANMRAHYAEEYQMYDTASQFHVDECFNRGTSTANNGDVKRLRREHFALICIGKKKSPGDSPSASSDDPGNLSRVNSARILSPIAVQCKAIEPHRRDSAPEVMGDLQITLHEVHRGRKRARRAKNS